MHRFFTGLPAVLVVSLFALMPAFPQTSQGNSWQTRTPDGQPDIEGYWSNATITPFERPAALADKAFVTEQEEVPSNAPARSSLNQAAHFGE